MKPRCRCVLCTVAALVLALLPHGARADAPSLDGVVTDATGTPMAQAQVAIDGQNLTLHALSDSAGRFAFPSLIVGTYRITARKDRLQISQLVDVPAAGVTVRLVLGGLRTIGTVVTSSRAARRSGTDVTLGSGDLAHMPASTIPELLVQLPSAARGSNGQIHINGDHNGLNYYLDGVQIPANLNRVVGSEVDAADVGFVDVLEGAYPAQYGDKFAAVLDIGSKSGAGPAGAAMSAAGGSYAMAQTSLAVHAPVGPYGGSLLVSGFAQRDDWALDPPVSDPVHDAGSDTNAFLRVSLPFRGGDTINFDAVHALQTFQIPPDTGNGVPPQTDDDEYQNDTFLAFQYRHPIGTHGAIRFGPSVKLSRILDTNDPVGDLAAGGPRPPAGETNCVDFTNCLFSVYADRNARDYRFNVDYTLGSAHHTVSAGALYDATVVAKNYQIVLQPYSAKDPQGSFVAIDVSPNVAHQQEAYVQDAWTMGRYELDYGLRADAFQIFSTNFRNGFSQLSPRIELTRAFGPRASVYAYFGRLFVPFSFENVNPVVAASLYYAPPPATFDLRPQRDSLYEMGGHAPLGGIDVGIRIMHKVSSDWLDDTQVGATNLHQDINFPAGRVDAQSVLASTRLAHGGRAYASVTHSMALNSLVCETNLLQNCSLGGYASGPSGAIVPYFVAPGGPLVQADHDQHWDANGGCIFNDARGGWLSLAAEYGSGLSFGDAGIVVPGPLPYALAVDPNCATGNAVNCKVPPHLTFDLEKGVRLGNAVTAALTVTNLLNDRYGISVDSSLQGTHFARPRAFVLRFDVTR